MSKVRSSASFLSAVAVALLLTACASPANREAMTPQNIAISKLHPYSVRVQTAGGADTGAMDSSNISDADLKAAIEDAIARNKSFASVIQGSGGDYLLSVTVTNVSKPLFGGTFTVDMESAWSLTKVAGGSVVMRKAIKSSASASMSDSLVGVTRLKMAVEGAARENIAQGLKAIAELNL